MNLSDYATYNEITTQYKAWAQTIDLVKQFPQVNLRDFSSVTVIGCGSTYYLSLALASLFQSMNGISTWAVPSSELLLNPESVLPRHRQDGHTQSLLIAVSRSGTTTETLKAVELFRERKAGQVISISNNDETLSQLSDASLIISEGREESIAQTRSFSSMFLAGVLFSIRQAGRLDLWDQAHELPAIGEKLIRKYTGLAQELGSDLGFENFYLLGSGFRYGLACEISLKLKEMTLSNSEPFHFMEFRHGPMSMVNNRVGIIGLVSEKSSPYELKVLDEMLQMGSRNITIGERGTDVAFDCGLSDELTGVLYLPVLQLMAFFRSIKKGLNPDRPLNLQAVVKLEL